MDGTKKIAATILVTALIALGIVVAYGYYVSARVPNYGAYGNSYPNTNYGPYGNNAPYNAPNNNYGQYGYGNTGPYNNYGPYSGSYGPYGNSGTYNNYGPYGNYPYGGGMMDGFGMGMR